MLAKASIKNTSRKRVFLYYNSIMNIAIITGGTSSEREVSLSSARTTQQLLDIPDSCIFDYPNDLDRLQESIGRIDTVIPMIHGVGGEDGEVSRLLETMCLPYIFSLPASHAQALDKTTAKQLVSQNGITVAREYTHGQLLDRSCFVKPRSGGSSIDTCVVENNQELDAFITTSSEIDFLIEEKITGREFTVGVIEKNGKVEALPVVEIISDTDFFDYESKYNKEKLASEICPAHISKALAAEMKRQAIVCHEELDCRHLSRTDFMMADEGTIYFLETNTIPGMTATSLIPKMVHAAGYDLKDLFMEWIREAQN